MHKLLLSLLLTLAFLGNLQAQNKVTLQPGRFVFKLKPEFRQVIQNEKINHDNLRRVLTALGATKPVQKFPRAYLPAGNPEAVDLTLIYQIKVTEPAQAQKATYQLLQTGLFSYVEQLRKYEPLYQPNDPLSDSLGAQGSTQYYLKRVRALRGWDFEKGDSSVVIGVLDTGILYTHQDLKNNLKKNYADRPDGIDNDNDGFVDNHRGWDMADNDNDATADQNGHGVAVTGVAAATPDNGKLIAGVGFKSKFLPIKIFPSTANGNFAGYEGIVYAADHGCQVINLSWGGYAQPSAFELDVVTYAAVNRNAVIVAAAGNTNGKLNFYPATYQRILSVGSLNEQNVKSGPFTYSHQIDVGAPGEGIVTLWSANDSSIIRSGGSSLACPIVAGAAALVRRKFPTYTAEQVIEQIRSNADASIYSLPGNANYQDLIGKGLLDIAKALTNTSSKSVRFTRVQTNPGSQFLAGDTVELIVDFRNYLAPLANLNVTVSSASPNVTVLQSSYAAGAMATLATKTNSVPFRFKIAPNAPLNEPLNLKFTFTDGTYSDFQYYEAILNPDFVTIDVNKLAVTVTSTGNIGFKDLDPQVGNGVRYRNVNLLAEGGLMVGNSPATVSDNIRFQAGTDTDFHSVNRVHFINALPRADMEAVGMLQDSFPQSAGTLGIDVNYRGYAWQSAPKDKFVILEYRISNPQALTLTNVYAGLFTDWDIFDSNHNRAVWDAAHKMGYVFNVNYDTLFTGVKLLSNGPPSFYAIDNFLPAPGTINISDGFTNAEKFQALAGGVAKTSAGSPLTGNDISLVIGEKLPDLAPNQSGTLAVAIIAGETLADLQASAQAAQAAYTQRALGRSEDIAATNLKIFPNPAKHQLIVQVHASGTAADLTFELVDAVGRKVKVPYVQEQQQTEFDTSALPAGLYVLKVSGKGSFQTRKVQLVK